MEEVPLLFKCGTCGNGFIERVDPGRFESSLADQRGREISFRQQVECPKCRAMIEVEFTIDKKSGRTKKPIHATKKESGSVWLAEKGD